MDQNTQNYLDAVQFAKDAEELALRAIEIARKSQDKSGVPSHQSSVAADLARMVANNANYNALLLKSRLQNSGNQ